ncbi:MAG: hypothetical protein U5K43_11445 [Halofilum sp. (in: g-proteobacteria)]|nr:hypothetical protein [Halofilum sp. (in: g-proteobacteria)]
MMGAAAAAGADVVIVTDDNPRGEDPAAIVAGILEGMPPGSDARVEHDRGRALAQAVAEAGPDDLVLDRRQGPRDDYQDAGRRGAAWSRP